MKRQRGRLWLGHSSSSGHTDSEGKFEDFKANSAALADVVESNEPRIIAFNIYANEKAMKSASSRCIPTRSR